MVSATTGQAGGTMSGVPPASGAPPQADQPPQPASRQAEPQPGKLYRSRSGKLIAGVSAGIAEHLGVPVLWVRLVFAVLAALAGAGVVAYALCWMFVPMGAHTVERRTTAREQQQALGLVALGLGLAMVGAAMGDSISGWVTGPLGVAVIGAAVVWREADESQRQRWRSGAGAVFGTGGGPVWLRVVAGVGLVTAGIAVFLLGNVNLSQVQFALLAVAATLVGVAVLTVPWWLRMMRDLSEERRARIRTEERAEIAAHLHDSVLQTLALIQKQADQSREVRRLARGQERELRTWLYGPQGYGKPGDASDGAEPSSFSEALSTSVAEIEDTYAVSVQAVVVGDCSLTEPLAAMSQAAREAVVNAAKHAEVEEISVYAEIEPTEANVFVRDRGVGFDPDSVGPDRHGLANSIRGRMQRYGGTVRLRSKPGYGTEVQLTMTLTGDKSEATTSGEA